MNAGFSKRFYVLVTFPNSPFRLDQLFPPAGDQPEAIDKLTEGMTDGLAFLTLLFSRK